MLNFAHMSTIAGVSFTVRFNLTGAPTLVLTDTTSTPPSGLVGIFEITQPDGYTRTGDINSPDIAAAGGSFSYTLRLSSTGAVQCGNYTIKYTAAAPGRLSTDFTRSFQFTYAPVELTLTEGFDVFTPNLSYKDDTVYSVANYNNSSVTRAWSAISTPTGTITGSLQTLSLQFGGQYYDANYAITLTSSLTYTHQTYSWLTITEVIAKTVNTYADTPPSPEVLVNQIHDLKVQWDDAVNNCKEQDELKESFEFAQSLFKHIIDRILVDETDGIYDDIQDLIRILANNQIPTYTPTNLPIPPYDVSIFAPGAAWGNITGTITNQTDLVNYIATQITSGSYSVNIGNGSATNINVTHGLNSLDVVVEVFKISTGETVYVDTIRTGVNTVRLSFANAPTTNQYRVVIKK